MIIAKILSILFGLIVISKTWLEFRKKNESIVMSLFWIIIWASIIVLSLFPALIDQLGSLLGDKSNSINTFIGAAFIFLFFITYRIYTKANRLERQMHEMVMKLGLKDIEQNE